MENFLFISFGTFDKNSSVMQRWITNGIEWRGLFFAKRRRVAVPCTRYIHIVARKKKGGGGWARNRRIRIRFTSIQERLLQVLGGKLVMHAITWRGGTSGCGGGVVPYERGRVLSLEYDKNYRWWGAVIEVAVS